MKLTSNQLERKGFKFCFKSYAASSNRRVQKNVAFFTSCYLFSYDAKTDKLHASVAPYDHNKASTLARIIVSIARYLFNLLLLVVGL
jgi:hypothetical protein